MRVALLFWSLVILAAHVLGYLVEQVWWRWINMGCTSKAADGCE